MKYKFFLLWCYLLFTVDLTGLYLEPLSKDSTLQKLFWTFIFAYGMFMSGEWIAKLHKELRCS